MQTCIVPGGRAWEQAIPFFAFSAGIRRVIYASNAVESLNRVIREVIKPRGSFPFEQSAETLARPGSRLADYRH